MKQKIIIEVTNDEMFALYVQIAQLYDKSFAEDIEEGKLPDNHMIEAYPNIYSLLAGFDISNLNIPHFKKEYNMMVKVGNDIGKNTGMQPREFCNYWESENDSV